MTSEYDIITFLVVAALLVTLMAVGVGFDLYRWIRGKLRSTLPRCRTCKHFDAPCIDDAVKLCDVRGSLRVVPSDGSGFCHDHDEAAR